MVTVVQFVVVLYNIYKTHPIVYLIDFPSIAV